jgi:hypothetical protein
MVPDRSGVCEIRQAWRSDASGIVQAARSSTSDSDTAFVALLMQALGTSTLRALQLATPWLRRQRNRIQ